MNDAQLRSFVEIARSKSINKAAANLYMAPSALRKQLDSLEREVGASSVVRGKTGAELTDGGKTFLDCAQLILETFARGCLEAREAQLACGKLIYLLGTSGQITRLGLLRRAGVILCRDTPRCGWRLPRATKTWERSHPTTFSAPATRSSPWPKRPSCARSPCPATSPAITGSPARAPSGWQNTQRVSASIYLPERPLADELPGNLAAELARLGAEVRHHGTGNDKSRCVMELIAGSHVGISVGPYTMLPESYRSVPLEWPGYPLTLRRTRGASPESQVLMEFFAAHYGGAIEPVG